jgi:hypothetical protein
MIKNWNFSQSVNPENFKKYLQELAVYLDTDLVSHFQNLLYIAQQDLSLAHCIHHNHVARVAILASLCKDGNDYLNSHAYHEVVCGYSAVKILDNIKLNNLKLSGYKSWLSNLADADLIVRQVPRLDHKVNVYVNLTTTPHTVELSHVGAIGMKGAAAGAVSFDQATIQSDDILGLSEHLETFLTSNYASYAFITNHLGLIIGLHNQLMLYPLANDIRLEHQLKTLELEISALKMLWSENLSSVLSLKGSDTFWHKRNTQYAMSKKVLLNLINTILELGIHSFVDDASPASIRFKDAVTFVTHMKPLYKTHKDTIYFRG